MIGRSVWCQPHGVSRVGSLADKTRDLQNNIKTPSLYLSRAVPLGGAVMLTSNVILLRVLLLLQIIIVTPATITTTK